MGRSNRERFMKVTNDNLNSSLMLCCQFENDDIIGVIDKVSDVYYKLFIMLKGLLENETYDIPIIPPTNNVNDDWTLGHFLALALAQSIVTYCDIFHLNAKNICEGYYEEAIIYWRREGYHVGNYVISERKIVPVPSFNHQGDLIFTYIGNTNVNHDVGFVNSNKDS